MPEVYCCSNKRNGNDSVKVAENHEPLVGFGKMKSCDKC
jgi:hypothetical protein